MAENKTNMADIANLMNQAKGASAAPAAEEVTIAGGNNDGGNNGDGGEKKDKKKKEVKDQSTLFTEYNIGTKNMITADSPAGKLMRVNSKITQIAGFIVPNSPRFEIAVSRAKISKKDEEPKRYETRINLKEKFSQQIKGVIVNECPELIQRINEERSAKGSEAMTGVMDVRRSDGTIAQVARKTPEVFEAEAATLDRVTKVYGYAEFIQHVIDYMWFEVQEAPEIFWSYKDKRTKTKDGEKTTEIKEVKSPADLRPSQSTAYQLTSKYEDVRKRYQEKVKEVQGQTNAKGEPKTVKTPTLKDIYPLSSKYRGRKLAVPGNFIAIKKFETINTKSTYSPEEQAEMNKIYIREAFSVNNQNTFQNKLNDMSAESKERVTITPEGDVTSSQFFNSNNSLVADNQYLSTLYRWWGKVDTVNMLDVKLVKKSIKHVEARQNKNGEERPAYDKYVLDSVSFGKPGNTLANAEYAQIVSATGGRLTDSDITGFIATLSTSSGKNPNTRGGINYNATIPSADLVASLQALANTVIA